MDFRESKITVLTRMDIKFTHMKMKYVFEPILSIPTGQTCEAIIDPIDPPDAAKFKPRALKFVGNIWVSLVEIIN